MDFIDYMIFCCVAFVTIGLIIGAPIFIMENTKIGQKIMEYISELFISDNED